MGKVKEALNEVNRIRNVEKEFASDAERKVVEGKIKDLDTLSIKSEDLKKFP